MNIPKKYQERVFDVTHDEGMYFINLNDGWEIEEGSSLIIADTVKDALAQLRETYKINYEVVVSWNNGRTETIGFEKKEKAERLKAYYLEKYDNQMTVCVRERI